MEWKRYGCGLARRCITYIKIKSTQPEVDSGSAGRMWTRRCNARLVLPSMLTGRKSGRVSDVQGGHRIGVAGRTILENGHIKAIHPITFLNVRFSHQMIGCAAKIRSILTDPGTGSIRNTLLIAPPRCGKQHVLRESDPDGVGWRRGKDRALL